MPDFAAVVAAVAEKGFFIGEGFWPEAETAAYVAACRELEAAGAFRPAAVGRGEQQARQTEIRSDLICWLEPEQAPAPLAAYLGHLEDLRQEANRQLWLGLFDYEIHAALYPDGAHYGRHLDRFRDDDARTLTAILYLNDDWSEADGGLLRFYPEGLDGPVVEVLPKRGTFVSFLSADYWHEVLPARRPRLALTGWFRRRK